MRSAIEKTARKSNLSRLVDFLRTGIWRIPVRDLSETKAFLLHELRIFVLAARGFNEDKCLLRASALTYYSLLSVVPILALAFGMSRGFGIEQRLERLIHRTLPNQQEVADRIIGYAQSYLENVQGGIVAGVGVVVLIWAVIQLMGHIEECFNDIWGVRKGRSLGRKFTAYLSVVIIAPLLLVMASSATGLNGVESQNSTFTCLGRIQRGEKWGEVLAWHDCCHCFLSPCHEH